MIEPYLLNIGLEILKAIGGVVVPAITIVLTIYANKVKKKLEQNERKADRDQLANKVDRLTQWALQAKSFQKMELDDRILAIMESAKMFMMENDIVIPDIELRIMIERSLQGLRALEVARHKIHKLRTLEVEDGLERNLTQ